MQCNIHQKLQVLQMLISSVQQSMRKREEGQEINLMQFIGKLDKNTMDFLDIDKDMAQRYLPNEGFLRWRERNVTKSYN